MTFTAPEQGWFRFIGVAASGSGGRGSSSGVDGVSGYTGGGGGGSGGIVVSKFPLEKGETVTISVSKNVSFSCKGETGKATTGGDGGDYISASRGGYGGSGGIATGGNIINQKGSKGGDGYRADGFSYSGGYSATNKYEAYSTKSGRGGCYSLGGGSMSTGGEQAPTSSGFVVISRGNTNLSSAAQNAYDITTLMLDNSRLEQEVTGIMLS